MINCPHCRGQIEIEASGGTPVFAEGQTWYAMEDKPLTYRIVSVDEKEIVYRDATNMPHVIDVLQFAHWARKGIVRLERP